MAAVGNVDGRGDAEARLSGSGGESSCATEDLEKGAPWRKRPHERRRGPPTSTEISFELSPSELLTRCENTRVGET